MIKNLTLKNILSALTVVVFSFILLGLTFMFYYWINLFYDWLMPSKEDSGLIPMYFVLRPLTLSVILVLLSWLAYRSKLGTIYKIIFTTIPIAVTQVFIGISLYHWPIAVYSIGTLFALGVLLKFDTPTLRRRGEYQC